MVNNELVFVIAGFVLSIGAFSLLLGDNRLFGFCASILTGALCAFACVQLLNDYFLPMANEILSEGTGAGTEKLILTAVIILSMILLFCGSYSHGRTAGGIQRLLLAVVTALALSGAANGTLTAFFRSLIGKFRIRSLSAETVGDIRYWVLSGTVLISALAALLFTRHYIRSKQGAETGGNDFIGRVGQIVVGLTLGAIAAGCFVASATIFINNISEISAAIRTLLK